MCIYFVLNGHGGNVGTVQAWSIVDTNATSTSSKAAKDVVTLIPRAMVLGRLEVGKPGNQLCHIIGVAFVPNGLHSLFCGFRRLSSNFFWTSATSTSAVKFRT